MRLAQEISELFNRDIENNRRNNGEPLKDSDDTFVLTELFQGKFKFRGLRKRDRHILVIDFRLPFRLSRTSEWNIRSPLLSGVDVGRALDGPR